MSFYVTHPYIARAYIARAYVARAYVARAYVARAYIARAYVLPTLVSFPDLCLPGPKNPALCFPALFCPDHCVCTKIFRQFRD